MRVGRFRVIVDQRQAENGTISHQQFVDAVAQALKAWRDGDWMQLAANRFADASGLLAPLQLAPTVSSGFERAREMGWLLQWGIGRMRPHGRQNWLDNAWRSHNLLHHYYELGWRVADVAEAFSIADQTFYDWRSAAVAQLAQLLRQATFSDADGAERRRFAMSRRYAAVSHEAQRLLQMVACVPESHAVSRGMIHQVLAETDIGAQIHTLQQSGLLLFDAATQTVAVHAQMRPYAQLQCSPAQRSAWLMQLGQIAEDSAEFLSAIDYFLHAEQVQRAATTLLDRWRHIVDANEADALDDKLQQILERSAKLDATLSARLRMVEGNLAESHDDLPTALRAYGLALNSADIALRAEAYYRRAKAYQRVDLDESLSHYSVCIPLLERTAKAGPLPPAVASLLPQMYIDRAMLYTQERADFARAEADLDRANALIAAEDSAIWSSWYNVKAGLAWRQNRPNQAIEVRRQAWVVAQASQHVERMTNAAYNLGTDYVWAAQYAKGMHFLQRAYQFADDADNLQMQGVALKGMGNCYVLQEQFAESIPAYDRAYAIFAQPKNPSYLASTCIDLAEAHAALGAWPEARRYFAEAGVISAELDHPRYRAELNELAERFPRLVSTLTPRQQQVVAFVKSHGAIRRPEYIDLIGVSKSQAHRDLEELCQQQILERVGKGRATRYVLVVDAASGAGSAGGAE